VRRRPRRRAIRGEEFAVILRVSDGRGAAAVAERIRSQVASGRGGVAVTASIGLAVAPEHGDHSTTVLAAADAALYRAKASGRNRVVVASADRVGAAAA
jgi:diguanylate cyclase (GGDEF)-like protein